MSKARTSKAQRQRESERLARAVFLQALLTKRLDAAGKVMLTASPVYSAMYAHSVLGRRWKWAEPVIATDGFASYKYADLVIKGRFPLAEQAISQDAHSASLYATRILKAPFVIGEKSIAKDAFAAARYAASIIKGRWKKGEKAIMEEPQAMLQYARGAIKGRLPDAMHSKMVMLTMTGDPYAKKYASTKKFMEED
jgi:hypothetical protein